MKKILTTTALASALVLSANYGHAQTTVTGQLDLGYKAYERKNSGAKTAGSYRGFTRETQINVQNKGKLSNGLDYTAGFAWEIDGSESVSISGTATSGNTHGAFSENTYINLISGNTTLHLGADHIQNPNFEITNLAGGVADIDDLVADRRTPGSTPVTSAEGSLAQIHGTVDANSASQAHGIGLIQNFGVARASIFYTPGGAAMANDGSGNSLATDAGQSQIEMMVRGDFGVKGLDAFVYRGMQDSDTPGTAGATNDKTGMKYGLSYNFGQLTFAASQSKVSSNQDIDAKTTSLGAAFAVNKELTIGLMRSKTSADGIVTSAASVTPDETLKAINIGYNLGPVVANVVYVDADSVGGVTGTDPKVLFLNLTTKF